MAISYLPHRICHIAFHPIQETDLVISQSNTAGAFHHTLSLLDCLITHLAGIRAHLYLFVRAHSKKFGTLLDLNLLLNESRVGTHQAQNAKEGRIYRLLDTNTN